MNIDIKRSMLQPGIKLTANDKRLFDLMKSEGVDVKATIAILTAMEEITKPVSAEEIAKKCNNNPENVLNCVNMYDKFGVIGAACYDNTKGWCDIVNKSHRLQAALKVCKLDIENVYTDINAVIGILADGLNKDNELLKYFGDVANCNELKIGANNALYVIAVKEDLIRSYKTEVDNIMWQEALLANCIYMNDVIPITKLSLDNLEEVRIAFNDFLEITTRPSLESLQLQLLSKEKIVTQSVDSQSTDLQSADSKSMDSQQEQNNDLISIRQDLNIIMQYIKDIQQGKQDVAAFTGTMVNKNLSILDFINLILQPYNWELHCSNDGSMIYPKSINK